MKRKAERKARLEAGLKLTTLPTWIDGRPCTTVKTLLELEASKPMRGGERELSADSLFGDGFKQGALF